jgi:hypothetical protein
VCMYMGKSVCVYVIMRVCMGVVSYLGLLVVWLVCLRRVLMLLPALVGATGLEPAFRWLMNHRVAPTSLSRHLQVRFRCTSGTCRLSRRAGRPLLHPRSSPSVYPGLVFGRRGVLGCHLTGT